MHAHDPAHDEGAQDAGVELLDPGHEDQDEDRESDAVGHERHRHPDAPGDERTEQRHQVGHAGDDPDDQPERQARDAEDDGARRPDGQRDEQLAADEAPDHAGELPGDLLDLGPALGREQPANRDEQVREVREHVERDDRPDGQAEHDRERATREAGQRHHDRRDRPPVLLRSHELRDLRTNRRRIEKGGDLHGEPRNRDQLVQALAQGEAQIRGSLREARDLRREQRQDDHARRHQHAAEHQVRDERRGQPRETAPRHRRHERVEQVDQQQGDEHRRQDDGERPGEDERADGQQHEDAHRKPHPVGDALQSRQRSRHVLRTVVRRRVARAPWERTSVGHSRYPSRCTIRRVSSVGRAPLL